MVGWWVGRLCVAGRGHPRENRCCGTTCVCSGCSVLVSRRPCVWTTRVCVRWGGGIALWVVVRWRHGGVVGRASMCGWEGAPTGEQVLWYHVCVQWVFCACFPTAMCVDYAGMRAVGWWHRAVGRGEVETWWGGGSGVYVWLGGGTHGRTGAVVPRVCAVGVLCLFPDGHVCGLRGYACGWVVASRCGSW